MEVLVNGDSGDLVAQLAELHAPRQRRRFTPATTGGKAALTTEKVTNGDSGRASVRGFPPRQLVASHQEITGDHRADQSAVEDAAGTQKIQRQELKRLIAILGLG